MAIDIFGFTIGRKKDSGTTILDPLDLGIQNDPESFVAPETYDGTYTFEAGGVFGTSVDFAGQVKNENALIQQYRGMSLYPEVDQAIEDIVNESVVPGSDFHPARLDLDNLKLSEIIKSKMHKEFDNIIKLLDFNYRAHDIFRRWYIDSKLYYHIIIDNDNPQKGIIELRPVDAIKIKRMRTVKKKPQNASNSRNPLAKLDIVESVDEYFVYTNTDKNTLHQTGQSGIKISTDSICYVHSGMIDGNTRQAIGYLHKAIRPLNMLRQIEDAVVIYRISRAPERRIFYIDVGNLPKQKAEQYVRELMNRYRTKVVYDKTTGTIRDDRDHLSMLEDYWLPRREGGRGTEITTLPGGQNLGQMEDVEYLQKKMYRSLNVPVSRLESDNGFNMGKSSEITRDEVKFQKFIQRLQVRFQKMFMGLLRTQMILKGISTEEDWRLIEDDIRIVFNRDTYFEELKENEVLTERLNMLNNIQPFIGKFFPESYIRKNILKMTDEEIKEIQDELDQQPEPPMVDQEPPQPTE